MYVFRKLLWRKSLRNNQANGQINRQTQHIQTLQSTQKASKIKEAIKSFIIESIKVIGKALASAIITTVIVKATKLLEIANSDRPQFAIGGEWILIISIFVCCMFGSDWFIAKSKKSNARSEEDYEYLESK